MVKIQKQGVKRHPITLLIEVIERISRFLMLGAVFLAIGGEAEEKCGGRFLQGASLQDKDSKRLK